MGDRLRLFARERCRWRGTSGPGHVQLFKRSISHIWTSKPLGEAARLAGGAVARKLAAYGRLRRGLLVDVRR
jgi:hypothetical protein